MSVGTDPRYGRLADRVLAAWSVPASGRVDVKRAILAQWQCEQPANAWPPKLNNPGFVTLGALHSWGLDLGATCGKQYPSFCLALFPSPEAGADAYAGGVLRGSRYSAALSAARAGHGLVFLNQITKAGWGTRYSCARVAYASLGGKVSSSTGGTTADDAGTGPAPSSRGTVIAVVNARSSGSCSEYRIVQPQHDATDAYPIPRSLIGQPCVDCAPGYVPAIVATNPLYWALGWVNPSDFPGQANACVRAGTKPGDSPFLGGLPGVAGQVAGDWVAPLIAGIGELGRNLALLLFILALLLIGLYVLATADDRPGPSLPVPA